MRTKLRVFTFLISFLLPATMLSKYTNAADASHERTLEEVKSECVLRAENNIYPLIGLDSADVKDALSTLHSLDPDEWASAWMRVGDKYMAAGKSAETMDRARADADYLRAWRLYHFGNWPVPTTPGKQRSYAKALAAFRSHGRLLNPPIQVVHIPFEGSEMVGYLRLPKASGPVPFVIAINGADSRKENMSYNFDAAIPHGIGYIAVDTPGTGESPIKESPTADRMYSRLIDYLLTRPEIDKNRIAAEGQSYGAYWATKLAITERSRLKVVIAQSPGIHAGYTHGYDMNTLLSNREYLFGLPQVVEFLYGVKTLDEASRIAPKMSLVNQQLLGKPTAPMLVIAGVKDTLVPMSDIDLIMESGDVPKEAWINPQGGHLGRQKGVWPDPVIFKQVIIPWLVRKMELTPQPSAAGQ